MNCMEVRALVEDALDESLAGSRRRALDLHLSRCDACRAFFDAERAEHRRWFLAMNEPMARRWLPQGFAEGFLAEVAERHAKPQRRWAFLAAFRRVAAVLVAMAIFAGLVYAAAVVANGKLKIENGELESGASLETMNQDGVSRLASDVSGLSESSAEPAAPNVSENQSTQPQGEQPMVRQVKLG
ncbi:MAG: zf-HC2 domain-containing protein [Kiritimatiellae bacterium]|nr:zf-HC2 domain-containing protein [Kiritimatiellia bacterium]